MVTSNIPTDKEQIIQLIEERTKKIKKRLDKSGDSPTEVVQEKKDKTQPKKKYKSFMKVASILAIFALTALLIASITMPNFYEVIASIFRELFPSFGGSSGIEYYVN